MGPDAPRGAQHLRTEREDVIDEGGTIEETQGDPFYYLRSACQERHGCGLYALPLPPQLHGMACYLPDDQVPRTMAYEARVAKEAEESALLLGLDDFEANLPPMAAKKGV